MNLFKSLCIYSYSEQLCFQLRVVNFNVERFIQHLQHDYRLVHSLVFKTEIDKIVKLLC